MHLKTKREKGLKHLLHIRFMQKVGKTDYTGKRTQQKNRLTFNN